MAKNIKLIVADLEGCITPNDCGPIDPKELATFHAYCASVKTNSKLPPMVFCSGRQVPYVEAIAQFIGAMFDGLPSVCESGACLYFPKSREIIENPAMTAATKRTMLEVDYAIALLTEEYKCTVQPGKNHCITVDAPEFVKPKEFHKVVKERLAPWMGAIEVSYSGSAVDITPAGVNKGSGLEMLSEITGITVEDMLAIGDAKNDLPMLLKAGISACPADASPSIRRSVDYVATNNGPAGVVEILRKFIT